MDSTLPSSKKKSKKCRVNIFHGGGTTVIHYLDRSGRYHIPKSLSADPGKWRKERQHAAQAPRQNIKEAIERRK
jgi:hypothetical protein